MVLPFYLNVVSWTYLLYSVTMVIVMQQFSSAHKWQVVSFILYLIWFNGWNRDVFESLFIPRISKKFTVICYTNTLISQTISDKTTPWYHKQFWTNFFFFQKYFYIVTLIRCLNCIGFRKWHFCVLTHTCVVLWIDNLSNYTQKRAKYFFTVTYCKYCEI